MLEVANYDFLNYNSSQSNIMLVLWSYRT